MMTAKQAAYKMEQLRLRLLLMSKSLDPNPAKHKCYAIYCRTKKQRIKKKQLAKLKRLMEG